MIAWLLDAPAGITLLTVVACALLAGAAWAAIWLAVAAAATLVRAGVSLLPRSQEDAEE